MSATAGSGGMSDPSTRDPTLPSRRSVRTRRHRHAAACETVWVHLLRLPLRTIARWPLVAGALVVLSAGCSEQGRTVGAYCDAVATRLELVVSPPLAWDGDIGAVLEAYRAITATAPAAIEPEWAALVSSLETVSTVVPDDPVSVAAATDTALASTPAATRIQQYTRANCAIDIGTPPPPTNPVTATTDPAAPPTAPAGGG